MFQPSTSELGSHDAPPERETVIKFVISGPFLNAEAARTEWSAEPPPASAIEEMMRRISDLERKLDEERALVQMLSSQMPEAPTPAPPPARAYEPPPPALAPRQAAEPVAEPADAPAPRYSFEPAVRPPTEPTFLTAVQSMAENAARTMAEPPPPPPPLSTVARTPPPKVRGLRRMIGALRRL